MRKLIQCALTRLDSPSLALPCLHFVYQLSELKAKQQQLSA